jgi:Uroporphyrinogen-III synthase
MYGAENLVVGNSDALFLANKVKCYLPKNSKILWPSNNILKDSIYINLENNVYNVDKKQTYATLPLKELDINSTNLILNKQVLIVLFFSFKSTEMWIELINKANLFKFLNNINFIGINEKIVKYLCDLSLNKVFLSRRKRRASVLSLGMKVFNKMEKSL